MAVVFCEYVRNVKARCDGRFAGREFGNDDVKKNSVARMCAIEISESRAPTAKPNSAEITNARISSRKLGFDVNQHSTVSSGGPPKLLRYHSLFTTVKLILF